MTQVAQPPYSPAQPTGQQQQFVPSVPYATTLYTASGSPVQIVNVNSGVSDGIYHGYKTRAAKILGLLQILLGLITIITQIVTTAIKGDGYQAFSGFWASVIFIIAGAFGIQSSKTKSQCTVVTTLVLSILAAVCAVGPIAQGAFGVGLAGDMCYSYGYYEYAYYDDCKSSSRYQVSVVFHAIMICCGLAEGVVAIVAAAYCCHGCCCYSRPGIALGQAPGGMQLAVQYQPNAQYYPPPVAPVGPSTDPAQALPEYSAAPPPQYSEKV